MIKDDIKCLYSMYNKSVFDAELSILNVFKDKLLLHLQNYLIKDG